jgi:hypothetical protein
LRLLRLTDSNDLIPAADPSLGALALFERSTADGIGEPVETLIKVIWPDAELPGVVESWMERYHPDVVLLRAASYWVTYESVPLRLRRKAFPGTGVLARVGAAAGARPWIASSLPFRVARSVSTRILRGDTYFTPEDAAATVAATLRRIVVRESVVTVVRGPFNSHNASATRAGLARAKARTVRFDALLASLCAELHVPYLSIYQLASPEGLLADGVHSTLDTRRILAHVESDAVTAAVVAARA